ncbi:MAG TPA: FecR domain-containing protein [Puia sp.]|nr:FecR domain-containing protein [Puia sp.]
MLENYREPEDLLADESFLSWYFQTDARGGKDWQRWMESSPDRRQLVDQAVNLLNTTRIQEKEITSDQARAAETALMSRLSEPQTSTAARTVPLLSRRRWMAAASILVLLTAGLFITKAILPGKPQIASGYGQILTQHLPDGTEVTMNANSKLSYSPGWKDGIDREVWINGEAFFHVRKTPLRSRFIVHTDHFDIIVTGTQFNVVNRHDRDYVMLKEGSVIVHASDGKELNMAPGDFVEFDKEILKKSPCMVDCALAWKEHKLMFDNTPLRELVTIIHDQYGVDVRLENQTGGRTISGIISNDSLETLLQALEATGDFEVERKGNDILIKGKTPQN